MAIDPQLNIRLSKELKKELEFYCVKNDRKQKEVVALALEQFLKLQAAPNK